MYACLICLALVVLVVMAYTLVACRLCHQVSGPNVECSSCCYVITSYGQYLSTVDVTTFWWFKISCTVENHAMDVFDTFDIVKRPFEVKFVTELNHVLVALHSAYTVVTSFVHLHLWTAMIVILNGIRGSNSKTKIPNLCIMRMCEKFFFFSFFSFLKQEINPIQAIGYTDENCWYMSILVISLLMSSL